MILFHKNVFDAQKLVPLLCQSGICQHVVDSSGAVSRQRARATSNFIFALRIPWVDATDNPRSCIYG